MKTLILSILLSLLFVFVSDVTFAQVQVTETDDSNQKIPKYGNDSITCIMNISLYKEFYKQWKASKYKNESIKDAIKPWRYVFLYCPASMQSLYLDGIKIMTWRIKNEKDKDVKEKLIDTLMMVYDKRIKYFNKEGYVLGRKGVEMYKFHPENYEEIYNILNKSVELEGDNSYPDVLVFFMRTTKKMIDNGKAPEDIIFDNYEKSSGIIDHNLDKFKDDTRKKANWENVKGNVQITFEPYATCEALIKIYSKKYNETPDDVELLKKIIRSLDKKRCTKEPLYFETTLRLYDIEPNPESAYLIGKMYLKQEEYAKSINFLKEGEKLQDEEDKANSYLLLSGVYKQLNNFPTSRIYALKAAKLMPTNGHPYIIIGDMYAESAKSCGDNDLTKKVAYWAAVDKYYKAKRIDPEIADIAKSRIDIYSAYFPTISKIFFHDLNEGDDYIVECWINEKTKIRAVKE